MGDMRKTARDLQSLANGMDDGSDPLRTVRAAQNVITRDVRVALVSPPANLGNCNHGTRLLNTMSKAFGKIEGGNTSRIAVAACTSVMRDIAKECVKW